MNSIIRKVCVTCKQELDVEGNPLSSDCGGDCWGCVGETEAKGGYRPSVERYNEEVDGGYRPGPKLELKEDV